MMHSHASNGISPQFMPDWLIEDMWRTGRDMNLRMTRLETLLKEREGEIARKLQSIDECSKKTALRVGNIEASRRDDAHKAELRRARMAAAMVAGASLALQLNADQLLQLMKVAGRAASLF